MVNTVLKTVILLLLIAAGPLHAKTIQVETDRDHVSMNESFNIVFRSEGSVDGDPDFSPLEKNFQILSTSQSSNFSLINGDLESSKTWTLTVLPRHSGNLTIPAIDFGSDRSERSSVMVEQATQKKQAGGDTDVFLRASASPGRPYVQAQVIYNLELYRAVPTSNASLGEPEIKSGDAVIERIGEDKTYLTTVRGKRYRVVARDYAVYPQASGELTIAPVEFRGHVSRNARSLLDPFGPQPDMVVRRSEAITLDVQPIPDSFSGSHWLPAEHVRLEEKWSKDLKQFRVGDPITRTLTLTAAGQLASQLPELPESVSGNFKQYPDQPALKNDPAASGLTGSRRESTALIPEQAGRYTLPAIRIPWWNTAKSRMEYAELPERTITVAAAPGQQGGNTPDIKPAPLTEPQKPAPKPQSGEPETKQDQPAAGDEAGYSIWLYLTVALILIWVITVLAWWISSRGRSGDNRKGSENRRQAVRRLKQACYDGDPRRAREHLMEWSRLNWPDDPPLNPVEAGQRTDAELEAAIRRLNDILYSNQTEQWDGDAFWRIFDAAVRKRSREKTGESGKLEPLNKL